MRTTVNIDDDVLQVAKDLAHERQKTLGSILSNLIRLGLRPAADVDVRAGTIPVLPRRPGARTVTAQAVKDLLEAEA